MAIHCFRVPCPQLCYSMSRSSPTAPSWFGHRPIYKLSKLSIDVTIPRDVQHTHVHTSPRCTAFSRAQNFKQSKDLSTVATECLHGLKFARSVHGAVSKKRVRRGVTFSQGHEQSAGCSTTRALPHVSRSAWAGVGRGFPWAISPTTPRVTIRACAVKQPTTKRWTFETTSEQLYKVLKHHINTQAGKVISQSYRSRGRQKAMEPALLKSTLPTWVFLLWHVLRRSSRQISEYAQTTL